MHSHQPTFRVLLALLCVLALLLGSMPAFAAASYPYATFTTEKVNLRQRASSGSTLLGRLEADTPVVVTGRSGKYSAVVAGSKTGYVLTSCLADYDAKLNTVGGYPYDTVTIASASLYKKNDKTSAVLGTVKKGADITVLGETNSYAKVRYEGTEGYVRKTNVLLKKISKAAITPAPATPVPTLAPGEDSLNYVTLSNGATGNSVTALQNALIELGYLEGRADGSYGLDTQAAVAVFQQINGFPVTGEADANLQAFLFSGSPLNASGAKASVKSLPAVEGVTIRSGSTGVLVGTMQIRLKELGYYSGAITMTHDSATIKALKRFQKANGLPEDGVAGAATQEVLFSVNAVAANATAAPAATQAPTPAPAMAKPSGTVQRGSSGADARLVQRRLKELGYYRGAVDGKFGAASVTALKAFQANNGLKADGKAGSETSQVLFSYEARSASTTPTPVILATFVPEATPTPTPTPTPEPLTQANAVTIRLGVTGDAVVRLQEKLTELGYYQANVDGVCKTDDAAAIRLFQEKNGLKVDGIAGYATQAKLYSETALPYATAPNADGSGTYATLRVGMTGTAVKEMQQRLIDLGYYTGRADGIFGSGTADALIAFQRANGLTRDGVAGSKTLQKLYSGTAAKAAATPAPKAAATAAPAQTGSVLRLGDRSTAVKSMQQRLIALGYLKGTADGKFGSKTQLALLAFQRANHLTADGVAGSKTLAAMNENSAINASGSPAVTPAPTAVPTAAANPRPSAASVQYENWYSHVKAIAKKYPYATVYDYSTGISWQVHIFSIGAHADVEPLTAKDTANLERAFGGNTWNPKAVWVVFGNGEVYMASTHSMPHEVQHRRDNNFAGHCCIHFPRTNAQVTAIGPYATSHQACIDAGWKVTQSMR